MTGVRGFYGHPFRPIQDNPFLPSFRPFFPPPIIFADCPPNVDVWEAKMSTNGG